MVYNFGAGPAMLPIPVMEQIQEEFLNFQDMGVSLIEISHRSKEFGALLEETDALFKELVNLPENYKILYVHGGAQMQFSAVPLNLISRKPAKKAFYFETGNFASVARKEAEKYGDILVAASSEKTNHDRIPVFDKTVVTEDASYAYITSNNTIYGTRWSEFPDFGETPLVVDATSEILSRQMDYSKFGLIFGGTQKNLGPSGLAMVIVREDLLQYAESNTPKLLDYSIYEKNHSLANTNNTFAIYAIRLVLGWLKDLGGVAAIEEINEKKAKILYDIIDNSSFYKGHAQPDSRSAMNVTFNVPSQEQLDLFLKQALSNGLYALKGHRKIGGARASIYNAMPIEGVQSLADFMLEFERKQG
ncbi:MAG: 3-phosphoserine/phosphohydroxythreonine transaminase [Proteobacteria bacterium]|nr:3-phosphoserine/phosphohydroxythreonine transaminase [Pseudomonadota bacterium]